MPVRLKKRAEDTEEVKLTDIVTDFKRLHLADLERGPFPALSETSQLGYNHEFTILVIDDNPDILRLMQQLLVDRYDLIMTDRAAKGLAILKEKDPDLVICDVMMPEMDGHEFCRRVKADQQIMHIPIMLVTSRGEIQMKIEGIEAGADDYLVKPFDPAELDTRVRSLLRIRKSEQQLAQMNRNLETRTQDLAESQRQLFLATIKSLVNALEAKDPYTRNHSARVTEYSLRIARRVGYDQRELKDLELAGLMHDLGKIAVPETILHKPGRLTDEEFAYIKAHPVKSEEIIQPITMLKHICPIVRGHHERYDGRGYPDGLAKLEIPLGARIMAVADTYDAMTSDRPYRQGLPHSKTVKEITHCSGTQFDPEVVHHFLAIADDFRAFREKLT